MERLTEFPVFKIGKVRDVYDLGDRLLIVASDRISAFDVVLESEIPEKGKILTQMSIFWMNKTRSQLLELPCLLCPKLSKSQRENSSHSDFFIL